MNCTGGTETLIEEEGSKLVSHENLMSIKCIGRFSGAVLLSGIGRMEDFRDPAKLAAHWGLASRVQDSNETEHLGIITKQCNKLARNFLGVIYYTLKNNWGVPGDFPTFVLAS